MRSANLAWHQAAEDSGISRFPNNLYVCVHMVSARG